MSIKKTNTAPELLARVDGIRRGLGPHPLAILSAIDPRLGMDQRRARRILWRIAWKGDIPFIERMERAKELLLEARNKVQTQEK